MPRRPHRRTFSSVPLVTFLLIASFGILFAGCTDVMVEGPESNEEDLTFHEEDIERFRALSSQESTETASGGSVPSLAMNGVVASVPTLDLSQVTAFQAIRTGPAMDIKDLYRVTNEFLNIRSEAENTSALLGRLRQGDLVKVTEFVNAGWAKIAMNDARTGYVAARYVGKLVPEERLAEEKKKYDGLYFVSFGFVNVRREPNQKSDKIGEIPGNAFVRPVSIEGSWARIPFEGKEAYVSMSYLAKFAPAFIVRQETFTLPILRYHGNQDGMLSALREHVNALRAEGWTLWTARQFGDLLLEQEKRDARLPPKTVIIAITDVPPERIRDVSDLFSQTGLRASLFLETRHVGIAGISEKQLLTLSANGADIQSAGHSSDDLRSLTNAQVELELKQSRKILEELTGKPVTAVAYPQGGTNERVTKIASDSGYLLGLGAVPARTFRRGELLQLPGTDVSPSLGPGDVLRIIRGS